MKTLLFRILFIPWMSILVLYCCIMAVVYFLFWLLSLEWIIDALNVRVHKIDDAMHKNIKKKPPYYIKTEKICGDECYMIYYRAFLFGDLFLERRNSRESAEVRLNELLNQK